MRLFVSVDLPPDLTAAVREVQATLAEAEGVRPTDPSQTHVTVKFLGEVSPGRLEVVREGVAEAVEGAGIGPFHAQVEGLGVFPDLGYISVIWLGFSEGAEALTALHEAVEDALVGRGFDPEEHAFTPHATIARMDHAGGKELVQHVVRERHPSVGRMRVEELRITESTRTPDGPVYDTVDAIELRAPD